MSGYNPAEADLRDFLHNRLLHQASRIDVRNVAPPRILTVLPLSARTGKVPAMRTIPAAIGKYVVEREIGRGASSTVYLGYDPFHRRQVAIKQIHAHLLTDPDQLARYRRHLHKEAAVSGKLNHPHIVRLLDADVDADPPYLVLEYVDGKSLSSFTSVECALSVPQVLDLAFKCCGALEHANENGLVHRDIKPANLILQSNGMVKVTDFGTALP